MSVLRTKKRWFGLLWTKCTLTCLLVISLSVSESTLAELGDKPVIGVIYNSAQLTKEKIFDGLKLSIDVGKSASLFTVGGLGLDAYILTLPLKPKVKLSVVKRLSDPFYAIPLGHFLYMFYDRYTGVSDYDVFKSHLLEVYSPEVLKALEHSLMSFSGVVDEPLEDDEKNLINRDLIAGLITIYDVLFNNDEWLLAKKLPENYTYLSDTVADAVVIRSVQAILLEQLTRYEGSVENADLSAAIALVIDDAKPENAGKLNNKAQALTITVIDFLRLNVLKSYRQFAMQNVRAKGYFQWMKEMLRDNPDALIDFLKQQNTKHYGVQIVVDGLQQSLLQSLAVRDEEGTFFKQVVADELKAKHVKFYDSKPQQPAHKKQLNYLKQLVESDASFDDPYFLPFFKQLYRAHGNSIASGGISSTPTISVRNLPLVMTGAPVAGDGGTGIPNFHFVDRELDRAYYFFGNDALQLDRIAAERNMLTMFDRLVPLKTLSCNAQYDWQADIAYDGLVNLALGEKVRDFGEHRCLRELNERAKVENKSRKLRATLVDEIRTYQDIAWYTPFTRLSKRELLLERLQELSVIAEAGMPDYVLMYIPWPDHFAHFKGPFSDEIISPTGELNRLDFWLGKFSNAYEKSGVQDRTLWAMAGDHGLAPVFHTLNPEIEVIQAIERSYQIDLNVVKISSDEGEGPKMTNALSFPSNKGADVVIASTAGGNFMMDFFNSGIGWKTQPVYQELKHWRPGSVGATDSEVIDIDLIAEISSRLNESLDYMVLRESTCSLEKCDVRLVSYRDSVRVDEVIRRIKDKVYYGSFQPSESEKLSGTQLLDIGMQNPYKKQLTAQQLNMKNGLVEKCLTGALESDVGTWCTATEWRTLTQFTPRPDSVNQLSHLYDEDRAGTINLFPKPGIGYNTMVPGRHAGEHFLEKDAFVGFWGVPTEKSLPLGAVDNASIAPTIFEYLTGKQVVVGEDGWGYPSLLNQLEARP